ncbi:MAG: glycosyltransferase family 39 protein [Ardenticatenaceae bacterium]|nr:glycosyltransferase family 39 protein [Ardenticatenaceae bacterium]
MTKLKPYQPYIFLGLILVAGLLIRVFRLTTAPPGLNGDELFNAIDAAQIGRGNWPVYFEGNNGREAFFFYLIALSQQLFGDTVFAMRLPSVLLGLGCIPLAYGLGNLGFNRRVGLIAAGLTAVSLWPVMESRWALRAVSLTFLTALTLYWLLLGWRNGRWREWLLGGVAHGLTLYTYIPSRVFPAVVLVWFGWLYWFERDKFRQQWRKMAVSLLVTLLVFAPYGRYIWQNPDKVNQRIAGLSVALEDALNEGEWDKLGDSVGGVLRMFTIHGDEEWRYHLSGQPVFDWGTGLFFYAGVLSCIWLAFRRKKRTDASIKIGSQPMYALLLLWLGAMLTPNLILEANSSFLRAAGAIVPIYLITAVGFDLIAQEITQRWPQLKLGVPLLIALGLILIFGRSWHDYFSTWNTNAEVRHIYQAELAQVGRFLQTTPAPEGTRVFVARQYAHDLAPQTFAYYQDRTVDWFNPDNSLVWSNERPAWYFFSQAEPIPAEIAAQIGLDAAVTPVTYADGQTAALQFQLEPGQLDWTPQHTAVLSFRNAPEFIGYDLPEELYRGDTISLLTHWQLPADMPQLPNQLTFVRAELLDGNGNLWASDSKLFGYPQEHWQTGDRIVQRLELPIPEGMPPGSVFLRFFVHDAAGVNYERLDDKANRFGPHLVRSRPLVNFTPTADMLVFNGEIALQASTFSTLIAPGLPLNISLNWVTLQPPAEDYQVELQLIQPGATEPFLRQQFAIWPDLYPPSQWQLNEQVISLHRLDIPLDMPTEVAPELRLFLLDADGRSLPITQGSNKLADLTLDLRERLFDVPVISQPTSVQFGESIQLLGYDLDISQAQAGGVIGLTLYWQALTTPTDNYTVFNQLLGSDGQIWGQFDSPPVGDAWITRTWLPGEIVIDERAIPVHADAPTGQYTLAIGLYTASDGTRLPVVVDGVSQPNDQLNLTTIDLPSE